MIGSDITRRLPSVLKTSDSLAAKFTSEHARMAMKFDATASRPATPVQKRR